MTHSLILHEIEAVTPDTYALTFGRPKAFDFEPGQAAELFLQKDGLADEGRPFTMVSQPDAPSVEFVIKAYPDHDGVTQAIPDLEPGDMVEADGPFGAITDRGPGVFLAAGAGVTPFIAILKKHLRDGEKGDRLIFANKTDDDIILKDTFVSMPHVETTFVVTDQPETEHVHGRLDQTMLSEMIEDFDQTFYICGPQAFVDDMRDALKALGAKPEKIVTEEGW